MNRSAALLRALPVACLIWAATTPLPGQTPQAGVAESITFEANGRALSWRPHVAYGQLILTVKGPGTHITREFAAEDEVKLDLGGKTRPEDGYYKWEIRMLPAVTPEVRRNMQAVREALDQGAVEPGKLDWLPKPIPAQSGGFRLVDGEVVASREDEPEPAPRAPQPQRVPGALEVAGDLTVHGAKQFAMPDPEDPGRMIVYAALEGPEVGTYYRGTAQIVAGRAVVELPEHFAKTTEPEGLTVQLTPLDGWSNLFVAERSLRRLVVEDADGGDGARFDFLIQGVRKGFAGFDVETGSSQKPVEVNRENR